MTPKLYYMLLVKNLVSICIMQAKISIKKKEFQRNFMTVLIQKETWETFQKYQILLLKW